jgi:Flp pilus assembly protein TadD
MTDHDDPTLEEAIAAGQALAKAGDDDVAIDHFRRVVERYPDDARAWAEYAYSFDRAGREEEALAPYRRALELGLPGHYVPGHLLGLGSTLRNVGRQEEAVRVLGDAVARFPDVAALRVFLAFAQHSSGDSTGALLTLLDLILASPGVDLDGYERAIRLYADEMR